MTLCISLSVEVLWNQFVFAVLGSLLGDQLMHFMIGYILMPLFIILLKVIRYKMLHKLSQTPGANPKQQVPILLAALKFPEDKYKLGLTKVFLRAGLVFTFPALLDGYLIVP